MEIYLPIIQVKIDILFILFLSFAVGVLSGLFGVGGGFLMTPFLIFLGIPPILPFQMKLIIFWRHQSLDPSHIGLKIP